MDEKTYELLLEIKEELQAIRSCLEHRASVTVCEDKIICQVQ